MQARCHAVRALIQHLGLATPGQKTGVGRHIGDQSIHLVGRVPEQDGLRYMLHTMKAILGVRRCRT